MARTETVFKMSIDDGNSVNTLKDLDKNSAKLKNSMDDLAESGDKTSDEFKNLNKAYEETIDTQKKLMGDMEHLGDDILVEVSGSISKMEDRLYELALSGDTVSKEFVELQQKTANYKKIIIETDRSVDALAEQGRGLSAALSISSGAVAGFQAFTGVQALLGQENEELLQTITKLQAAQGVLNSIEVIKQQLQEKSIALTRARTKVQKLYNLAIGSGTKGMKLFRGALLATGIGALIVGVGLLIANFDKLKSMLSGVTAAQKLSNEISNSAVDKYAKEASAADQLRKTINDENISREDKVKAVKKLQEKYPDLLSNIDAETATQTEMNTALSLNIKLLKLKAEVEAANELRAEKFKENLQERINMQSGANVGLGDALTTNYLFGSAQETANENSRETIKLNNQEIDTIDKINEGKLKKIDLLIKEGASDGGGKKTPKKTGGGGRSGGKSGGKSAAQIRAEEEAKALLELSLLQEELRRMTLSALELEELAIADKFDNLAKRAGDNAAALKQINEQQEKEMNALFLKRKEAERKIQQDIDNAEAARRNEVLDQIAMAEELATTTKHQQELNKVNDKYFKLIELATLYGEDTAILEQARRDELKIITDAAEEAETAKKKIETDKRKAIQQSYVDTVVGGLNALSSLNDLVADIAISKAEGNEKKQEKIAKRQFNVNKALQLGLAAIDGYKAITASLAQAPLAIGPVPNPAGIASLALAASTTAINIAKIASSKFKGSGSGGGGGSVPSISGTGASASSFSISDDTSSAQTGLNPDGTPIDGANGPTQVYVSEIDISNVQNGIEQIEVKSTF